MTAIKKCRNEGGFAVLVVAAWLVFFCFLAGLAIDVSHLYLVKGQLQNAADASALAGAAALYGNPTANPPFTPHWTAAGQLARFYASEHQVDRRFLTDCRIDVGFWNISAKSFQVTTVAPPGVCLGSLIPCTSGTVCPGTNICRQVQVPAVRVTLNKASGSNGGAVQTPFAKIFGLGEFERSASSLAFLGTPGAVLQGALFPFAIRQGYKDCYLSGAFNSLATFTLNAPPPISCPGVTGVVGDWTNLSSSNAASAALVGGFIDHLSNPGSGTPSPAVVMNSTIKDVNGVKDVLYDATVNLIAAGRGTVLMPVVDDPTVASMSVKGFVGVQLTSAAGSLLQGRFLNYYPLRPGPAAYGGESTTVLPPKLDQETQPAAPL